MAELNKSDDKMKQMIIVKNIIKQMVIMMIKNIKEIIIIIVIK